MKKIFKLVLFFMIIFSLVTALCLSYFMKSDIEEAIEIKNDASSFENLDVSNYKERINILLLGVDTLETAKDQKGTRSDTIMILSVEPVKKTGFILSIPRDTYVKISGTNNYTRINHAHSYGGTDLALATIKEFINIPIHHYIKVDYRALFKTVDDLGGVEFDVPIDMKYKDSASKPPLNIDLRAGVQTLNGEQAMGLLRFRKGYPDMDLGRIRTQQKFIQTVLDKIASPASVPRIPKYIDTIYQYVETDMSASDVLSIMKIAISIDTAQIPRVTIPGKHTMRNSMSVYDVDKEKLAEELNLLISGDYQIKEEKKEKVDLNTNKNNSENKTDNSTNKTNTENKTQIKTQDKAQNKIVILNGSGKSGVARRALDLLKIQDVNAEIGGNANNFNYENTQIYYSKDETISAKIRDILGAGKIIKDIPKEYKTKADIIIILGKDFTK